MSAVSPATPGLAERVLQQVANAALAGLMLFTVIDVFGRYVLGRPLPGGLEFTEFLMVALIFSALPIVSRRDEHVTVDLFDRLFPGRAADWQRAIGQTISIVLSLGLAWVMVARGLKMQPVADSTQILKVPLYPFAYLMAAMFVVNALAHGALLVRALRGRRT